MKNQIKNLSDIEINLAPTSSPYDYIAEFVYDTCEGQTTWYKCHLYTYTHSEWCEVVEGGYVVESGYVDEIEISRIDNITFYQLIGDDEIEKRGKSIFVNSVYQMVINELTEALQIKIENQMFN